ncbi:MAG: DUF2807 domain-containing protein [Parabacteroides sp.]|nr:DUF2807 domain-containing protein [Parabacteroides sp.]
MKQLSTSLIVALFLMVSFSSCGRINVRGDGHVVSKTYSITDFNELAVGGGNIELTYIHSDSLPSLKIEVDQNILNKLEVKVEDKKLTIKPWNNKESLSPTRFVIIVGSKTLQSLKMAGQGTCRIDSLLKCENLNLALAGSGSISVDTMSVNNLTCEIAGSGSLNLCGTAGDTKIKVAGSSNVNAYNLTTNKLLCEMAGSNQVEISVNESISAKIAGSGEIRYKGNPSIVDQKIAGSGSLRKVE